MENLKHDVNVGWGGGCQMWQNHRHQTPFRYSHRQPLISGIECMQWINSLYGVSTLTERCKIIT